MISVEQALARILGCIDVLEEEERSILDCLGQVLTEDVYSTRYVLPVSCKQIPRKGTITGGPVMVQNLNEIPGDRVDPDSAAALRHVAEFNLYPRQVAVIGTHPPWIETFIRDGIRNYVYLPLIESFDLLSIRQWYYKLEIRFT